jgi:DNA-binding Lrp family transcriptional regulator
MKEKILNTLINQRVNDALPNVEIAKKINISNRMCLKFCRELVGEGKLTEEETWFRSPCFRLILKNC